MKLWTIFLICLAACIEPARKERVIFYTRDQVSDAAWTQARADYESGLMSDAELRRKVRDIQERIEKDKLSLDIEMKAINQYIDEKVGQ